MYIGLSLLLLCLSLSSMLSGLPKHRPLLGMPFMQQWKYEHDKPSDYVTPAHLQASLEVTTDGPRVRTVVFSVDDIKRNIISPGSGNLTN